MENNFLGQIVAGVILFMFIFAVSVFLETNDNADIKKRIELLEKAQSSLQEEINSIKQGACK